MSFAILYPLIPLSVSWAENVILLVAPVTFVISGAVVSILSIVYWAYAPCSPFVFISVIYMLVLFVVISIGPT